MQKNKFFNFDSTYLSLPSKFYSLVKPQLFPQAELFKMNNDCCKLLNVSFENDEDFFKSILIKESNAELSSFAQAYAGHQFGNFTMLGDGRAIVLGEHLTELNQRFDIQLKGSGVTPYSRSGDGKATLKAMLREYLISEAMYHLNVPTSRSLAVIKTGESIFRQPIQQGASLVRVMKSHIRVGTFEFAANFGSVEDLKEFTRYTVNRLYPEIIGDENIALSLFNKVMEAQIDLVVDWMRIGFIHGVMNTDNTSISGETFDYGPCAFINIYHPGTVYSSIDRNGRYAFGNQPNIIKWNIVRFAEALLPIIHENQEKSIELAQKAINEFNALWQKKYYKMMLRKIGFETYEEKNIQLVDDLLEMMKRLKMDYTNTFRNLSLELNSKSDLTDDADFLSWLIEWKDRIDNTCGREQAINRMEEINPIFIPRNHLVEKALDETIAGDLSFFEKLLDVLSRPYVFQDNIEEFIKPSDINFDNQYQTFCGT